MDEIKSVITREQSKRGNLGKLRRFSGDCFVITLLAMTLFLTACDNKKEEPASAKATIKIGATLPLTGNAAEAGQAAKEAIEMAFNEWKQKGTKYNYEFIFEDDRVQPKQGVLNAQNFINVKKVNAILSLWTPVGIVISPLAEKSKVIHFTCAFGDKVVRGKYNFNNFTSLKEQSKALVEKLKKSKISQVSYAIVNTSGCIEQSDFVMQELKNAGINLIDTEYYNPSEKDFKLLIAKMEAKNPEYYLLCSLPPATQIFLSQFKEVTNKNNITSIDAFFEMGSQNFYLAEGLWYVNTASGTDNFSKKFKSATDKDLVSCTANLYDATNLLITSYENTSPREGQNIPNNEDVIKNLYNVKGYNGAIGNNLRINSDGVVESKASIKMIQNGKPIVIED